MISQFSPLRWLRLASTWLWHWLRRPWLAILACVIGLVLTLAVWQLPQIPGQLSDEHAAAANWLLNTSTAYGIWGNPFLALGLFDVLRSPLLYLLLTLLVPTLAAQLADQMGALRQQRGAQADALSKHTQDAGEALPLSSARPLYRWRGVFKASANDVTDTIASHLQKSFPTFKRGTVSLSSNSSTNTEMFSDQILPQDETRLLALRHPRLQYLRPLFMVGLLTAVIGAWVALVFGWQVTAPPLAPGSTFRSANRDVVLHYSIPTTTTLRPLLEATIQGTSVALPTDQTNQRKVGTATLQVRTAYPAIWIATADGNQRLTLPGDAETRSEIGLVFAKPGSEESILIPDQGAGLRIVQRSGSAGFVLELYRSDAILPIYRADLTLGGQLTVPFSPTDSGLLISSPPGLQVDVRHLPGLLLVPVGILLALVGAVAFLRQSAFVLVQIAAWAPEHSVIVLQSDHPAVVDELRATLITLSPTGAEHTDDKNTSRALSQPSR